MRDTSLILMQFGGEGSAAVYSWRARTPGLAISRTKTFTDAEAALDDARITLGLLGLKAGKEEFEKRLLPPPEAERFAC